MFCDKSDFVSRMPQLYAVVGWADDFFTREGKVVSHSLYNHQSVTTYGEMVYESEGHDYSFKFNVIVRWARYEGFFRITIHMLDKRGRVLESVNTNVEASDVSAESLTALGNTILSLVRDILSHWKVELVFVRPPDEDEDDTEYDGDDFECDCDTEDECDCEW